MCLREESMQLQTAEKRVLYLPNISFSITLEDRVYQKALSAPADQAFWRKDLPDLQISFAGFVHIFSGNSEKLGKPANSVYPVQVVLLNFSKEY